MFSDAGLVCVDHYMDAHILFTDKLSDFWKLQDLDVSPKCAYIYGLRSIDMFASKSTLALVMRVQHTDWIPVTFVVKMREDMYALRIKHFDESGKLRKNNMCNGGGGGLIMKNNQQRQMGTKLVVNGWGDIDFQNCVVVQEILGDPLLVNGRKIDLRIYLLVICTSSKHEMFVYHDGFVYYTNPRTDTQGSYCDNRYDTVVSSGYIDRSVYETNPLTLQDLYGFIGKSNAQTLYSSIIQCFANVHRAYASILNESDVDDGVDRFVLLGADVSPNTKCEVKLLEINKGPDFIPKDDGRDKSLKKSVVADTMDVLRFGRSKNFSRV